MLNITRAGLFNFLFSFTSLVFVSSGELTNNLQLYSYLFFSITLFIYLINVFLEGKINYKIIYLVPFIFLLVYSLTIRINIDVFTDYIIIQNLIIATIFFSRNSYDFFEKTLVPFLLVGGVISMFNINPLNGRFLPIPILVFNFYLFKKKDTTNIILLILIFLNIMYSGRRTSLVFALSSLAIFCLINYGFIKTFLIGVLTTGLGIYFIESISFIGYKRIINTYNELLTFQNMRRVLEIKKILTLFIENNSILNYMFGFGNGAKFYLNDGITKGYFHHVHFTPLNLYFRHGIFGLFLIIYMINRSFRLLFSKMNYLNLTVVYSIIDLLLRNVFVEPFTILIFGYALSKNSFRAHRKNGWHNFKKSISTKATI